MITLQELFTLPEFDAIHIAAGERGISRPVSGVNVIESAHLAEFFKKYELLITTGINMHQDTAQLTDLVETAFERGAAGIILNVGPYIPTIPEQVIRFADQNHFPVFSMPWVYRVADFVRISFQYLAVADQKQAKTEELFSEILFQPEHDRERLAGDLLQVGIKSHAHYAVIVCSVRPPAAVPAWMTFSLEEELQKKYTIRLSMNHDHQLIYMADRKEKGVTRQFFAEMTRHVLQKRPNSGIDLFIGVGGAYRVEQLSKSYREALSVVQLVSRRPELPFFQYKDAGVYRILLETSDKAVFQTFQSEMLGPLYRYDHLHQTDLVGFLRTFLDEDGRTTPIARKEFIHRNTVLCEPHTTQVVCFWEHCTLTYVQAEVTTLLPRLVPSRRIFFAALISLS
ncbi:PucR family transcriptional regulator ligand-binding domain-containing protein [Sporolactobacillus sp. THM19-2]|uniref:PucR family transcriptional regulator n=1 Tax=Sporolactobacillus sp. THM19-2 TaxID=2511171 RepID=UPI0013ECDEA1|nr:PucR family transcriptional regulator [Sporolactobacillus sp. THM19-2]